MLFLVAATGVQAQQQDASARPQRTPEEKAELLTKKLSKQLSLSDEQVQKVEAINKEHLVKLADLRKDKSNDRQSNRQSMATARQQYEASLQQVLSETQFRQYQEWRQKQQATVKERRGNR